MSTPRPCNPCGRTLRDRARTGDPRRDRAPHHLRREFDQKARSRSKQSPAAVGAFCIRTDGISRSFAARGRLAVGKTWKKRIPNSAFTSTATRPRPAGGGSAWITNSGCGFSASRPLAAASAPASKMTFPRKRRRRAPDGTRRTSQTIDPGGRPATIPEFHRRALVIHASTSSSFLGMDDVSIRYPWSVINHFILDAHAESLLRQIDPRLHREHRADRQGLLVHRRHRARRGRRNARNHE